MLIMCRYCKKKGYEEEKCFKKKFDVKKSSGTNESEEIALVANQTVEHEVQETWYADSEASCHMTNDKKGLMNIRENLNEKIMIGDGTTMVCKARGSLKLRVYVEGMKIVNVSVKEVLFVPELKTNLFSLSGVTKSGNVTVRIKRENIISEETLKGPISFFRRVKGETLFKMDCERVQYTESAFASSVKDEMIESPVKGKTDSKAIDVNRFHQRLGHPSEIYTKITAKLYGVKLKGKMRVCEDCTYGTAHQKPVKKFT